MPHTWVSSGYISAVRSLFVYEANNQLILAAGVDPQWMQQGMSLRQISTQIESMTYDIRSPNNGIRMQVRGQAKPPGGFIVQLPEEFHSKARRLNGQALSGTNTASTSKPSQLFWNFRTNKRPLRKNRKLAKMFHPHTIPT